MDGPGVACRRVLRDERPEGLIQVLRQEGRVGGLAGSVRQS